MVMHDYAPRFVLSPAFTRQWEGLGLGDDDLRALEAAIQADPDGPPVVRESGGMRKARFTAPGSGRGKRGAYRVGYAHFPDHGTVLLIIAWGKNEKADIGPAEAHLIREALRRFRAQLEQGRI